MVEPPFDHPGSDEQTPPHDPWAATERVPAAPVPPLPPTLPLTTPMPPAAPPSARYPYPGLTQPAHLSQPAHVSEPVILNIGEIQVTSSTVRTPVGELPLRGSQWHISDAWTTEQKIPTWAIVLAVVGFFCLTFFSLLFLLAKETVHRAVVNVHVMGGGVQYVARIPANDPAQVQHIYQQVNYVRSLAGM
jgi:hypothetical protein